MAKYFDYIGYEILTEDPEEPGVWAPSIIEKSYAGDILSVAKKYVASEGVNDDINLAMTLSIVADYFANEHLGNLKYITYLGSKWKVTKVAIKYPKQILTIGGLYNG